MISGISPAGLKPAHKSGACLVTWLLAAACVFLPSTRADAQQPAPNPSPARSYFLAAQKALAAGDSATAVEKLQRAVQADPKFAEAYLLLGLTEFQRGETEKSIQHYQQALKFEPQSYSGHYNLALAYLRERKLDDGRVQLEQAAKLDPIEAIRYE